MNPIFAALAVAALTPAAVAQAPPADPAAARIEAFYPVLLDTMKHGKALGVEGRVEKLKPRIEELFAFETMAQFATGPKWTAMTAAERQAITEAMSRYTVRNFAHNFASFSGEQLQVDPDVKTHGPDKLVKTTIRPKTGAPDTVAYRMRAYANSWKVIDVYYNAVSQVTLQRSEFAAALAKGGAPALVRDIDRQTRLLD